MRKIVFIISSVEKSLPFEWMIENLPTSASKLHFLIIGKSTSPMIDFLKSRQIPVWTFAFSSKLNWPADFYKLCKTIKEIGPAIVHAHLFDAGRFGITAAWLLRVPLRIYSRHYSSFHHEYFPKAVFIDKWINYASTRIVAISEVVRNVLIQREKVPASKVVTIHHGFDLSYFKRISQAEAKARYGVPADAYPVVGVISRYMHLKGINYIIASFADVLKQYPKAHLLLANTVGVEKDRVQHQLKSTLPGGAYTEIVFDSDVRLLYAAFDVFVHVPINPVVEAFGQIYVEALAMGVPMVCTLSGIAHEFIVDGENALVVDYKNSNAITNAITRVFHDDPLRQCLIDNGKKSVEQFSIQTMISHLSKLYGDASD